MAILDDLTKKAVKITEKTLEKSTELADSAKTKIGIKSAEGDLNDKFIELGKLYYEMVSRDNIIDQESLVLVQEIDALNDKIKALKERL